MLQKLITLRLVMALTKFLASHSDRYYLICSFVNTMLRVLLYALLIWFLYNLVFRLIIPVYRTTMQVKKKFREMQEEQNKQEGFNQQPHPQKSSSASHSEDYIDFEEIK